MGIADRIEGSVNKWRDDWGKALNDFLVNTLRWGLETLMNVLGQALAPKLTPLIEKLEATGEVPPELQPLLNEIKAPTGQVASMLAMTAGGGVLGGAIGKVIDALFNPIGYAAYRARPNLIPDLTQLLSLWLRGHVKEEDMPYFTSSLGYHPDMVKMWEDLSQIRLDSASWITAFRRKYPEFAKIEDDLKHQGWTDDRIEALKFVTLFIPTADEQTHWLAREVYEPEMVDRYGLDSELPNYEETDFSKVGVSPEQMRNKWMAHWEHASYMQIREMLRRGVLSLDKTMPSPPTTEAGWKTRDAEGFETMYDWFKLVEIPPFWRARLIEMAFEVPTRVDVRRFWDMRTIAEERLRSIYHAQGYHGKDLDDYVLWTKVYTAFPDLIARFKNGWITEDNVRSELIALGMPEARVDEMIQTKIKPVQPERVEGERTATATEIMKAVKKELITRSEGVERLGRMGYSPEEAEFKLDVYIGVETGSPETYIEFVEMTEKYRKAMGLEAQVPSSDLVEASKAMRQAEIALRDAESQKKAGEELAPYLKALSDVKYRYRQLLVSWEEEEKKK